MSLKPVSTQSQGAPFKTLSQISSLLLFKILILLGIQVKFLAMARASHSCPRYLRDPISHHSAPGALPSSWFLERSSRVFAPASGPSCSLFHLPGMLFPSGYLPGHPHRPFPHLFKSFLQSRLSVKSFPTILFNISILKALHAAFSILPPYFVLHHRTSHPHPHTHSPPNTHRFTHISVCIRTRTSFIPFYCLSASDRQVLPKL